MSVGRSHLAVISLLILALSLWSSVTDSLSSRLRQRALSSSNNEKDTSHATRTQERFYRINEGWLKELIGKENNKNNPACHCVRTFLWLSFSLFLSPSISTFLHFSLAVSFSVSSVFLCLSYSLFPFISLDFSFSSSIFLSLSSITFLFVTFLCHIHTSFLRIFAA